MTTVNIHEWNEFPVIENAQEGKWGYQTTFESKFTDTSYGRVHITGDNIYYQQRFGSLQTTPPYKDPAAEISSEYKEVYLVDETVGKFNLVARVPSDSEIHIVGSHLYFGAINNRNGVKKILKIEFFCNFGKKNGL